MGGFMGEAMSKHITVERSGQSKSRIGKRR
jgi:hypothetical protein